MKKRLIKLAKNSGFISNNNDYNLWMNELQKWLRNLETPIIVMPDTDFITWWIEIRHPDEFPIIIDNYHEGKLFNSYENALEYGLLRALELKK